MGNTVCTMYVLCICIYVKEGKLTSPTFPELLMPLSKKRKKSSDVSPNGDGARKK